MNKRFPLLSLISRLLSVIGVAVILAGVAWAGHTVAGGREQAGGFFDFLLALAGIVVGVLLIAAGELIGVVFAIEENTRRSADRLDAPSTPPAL